MKYLKKKNIQSRILFQKFEKKKKISKIVLTFLLNLRKKKMFSFYSKKKMFSIYNNNKSLNRVSNMCIITGRSRGVFKSFSASRFVLRTLMSFGVIPGYKKAVW